MPCKTLGDQASQGPDFSQRGEASNTATSTQFDPASSLGLDFFQAAVSPVEIGSSRSGAADIQDRDLDAGRPGVITPAGLAPLKGGQLVHSSSAVLLITS